MISDIKNKVKPRVVITRLSNSGLFRIDNIMNITFPYIPPLKIGNIITSDDLTKLINQDKYTFFRIEAEEHVACE